MAQQFIAPAAERPDAVALADERRGITWAALDDRVNRFVNAARAHGLGGGTRVAMLTGNRVEALEIAAACMHAGLTVVPINWHLAPDEVAYVLGDCGADALVLDQRYAALVDAGGDTVRGYRLRVLLPAPAGDGVRAVPGFADYDELLAASAPDEPADQRAGGMMFYTSGTTGAPKGAVNTTLDTSRPVDHIVQLAQLANRALGIPERARLLLSGPIYHSVQFVCSLGPVLTGREVVVRHGLDAAGLLRVIDDERVTVVNLVPTNFVRLLRLPEPVRRAFDGASLATVLHGAAPCPPVVKRAMIDWWGPKLLEYYGASEVGFLSLCDSRTWLAHPGTVGPVLPTMELTVLRDDGTPAAPGEDGLLYFRSRSGRDFTYLNDPAKTAAAHLRPGVFTFGDVGHVDGDGLLYISDRKADMIISGGVNIYPAEIEHVLVGHPAVLDVAVFGVPDPEYGEAVRAAVELVGGVDGGDELAEELRALAQRHLAAYKVPRTIEFVAELPRTPTGKVAKRRLRDPHWAGAGRAI
jgi:long-chain acyl-CoA synthetase